MINLTQNNNYYTVTKQIFKVSQITLIEMHVSRTQKNLQLTMLNVQKSLTFPELKTNKIHKQSELFNTPRL